MCVVSKPVETMAKTKILVAKSANNQRQLIVYANQVDNKQLKNAMILPVPNPQSLKFDDLTDYKSLFDDCEQSFYERRDRSFTLESQSANYFESLPVFSVGSYNVSVAMNYNDLFRVNQSVFEMDQGCIKALKEYQLPIYGFIICNLKMGDNEYHPLAYSHNISSGQIFVPTKHYHGDNFELSSGIANDWDHEIYFYNIPSSQIPRQFNFETNKYQWINEDLIKKEYFDFDFGTLKTFNKIKFQGKNLNQDVIINTNNFLMASA
jgi:hypothetical protein